VSEQWVIEFRNGGHFRNLEADRSCSAAEAQRFASRAEADAFMNKHEWILFNGGMAKRVK
jgi:hypothetical protein